MKFRRQTVENRGWAWWVVTSLALGLLLGAVTYWASLWLAPPVRIAPAGALSDQSGPLNVSLAKNLFGQVVVANTQVASPVSSNVKVLGIIAAGPRGSAILSVDGKPGKAFAVGDKVDGEQRLLSVDARQVSLGNASGASRQTLAVPAAHDISLLSRGPAAGASGAGGTAPAPAPAPAPPAVFPGSGTPTSPLTPPPTTFTPPPAIAPPGAAGAMPAIAPNQQGQGNNTNDPTKLPGFGGSGTAGAFGPAPGQGQSPGSGPLPPQSAIRP